tara:strand:+ start:200 stop:562 length:363 start_codon:yes stop_codon:yes gene_type:complete
MLFHWRGCKNHDFQPSPKTSPNVCENVFEIGQISIKCRSGCIVEKTTKNNAKNNTNCTKNHPQRVSHERGFRIPMLLKTTFYLHASSFFDMSYIFAFFLTFCEHLEIAVLPAWELTFREM